jgi:hypothetical protein
MLPTTNCSQADLRSHHAPYALQLTALNCFVPHRSARAVSTEQTRYFNNLQSVGQVYQAAQSIFPNWLFLETVKLHWPDPPGDQDGPLTVQEAGGKMEMCK